MMFTTTEIRWFFVGTIPEPVPVWYERICDSPAQPPRTDFYLRLNEGDSLGIKLREDRIEVKQREGAGVLVQLGEQAAGQVETWRKWPFELVEPQDNVTEQWVAVWKARRWCLFDVRENDRITPASPDTILEQGCACELTDVRLTNSSDRWWSLGFEAFGGTAVERRKRLLLVAQTFLGKPGAPLLAAEQSYSYPNWLQMLSE